MRGAAAKGPRRSSGLVAGAFAGAAGTAALNATTYLDMAVRCRPASTTPDESADRLLGAVRLLPDDPERRRARTEGAGALLGLAAGTVVGALVGVLRARGTVRRGYPTAAVAGGFAMLAGNGPLMVLGVSDPRTWTRTDWLTDLVPHLVYAATVGAALDRLRPEHDRRG